MTNAVIGAKKLKTVSVAPCFRPELVHQGTGAEESGQLIFSQNEPALVISLALKRRKTIPQPAPQGTGVKRRETSSIPQPRKTNVVGDSGARRKQNPLNILQDYRSRKIAAFLVKVKMRI